MDTEMRLQSIERDRTVEADHLQRVARARALWPTDRPAKRPIHHRMLSAFAWLRSAAPPWLARHPHPEEAGVRMSGDHSDAVARCSDVRTNGFGDAWNSHMHPREQK